MTSVLSATAVANAPGTRTLGAIYSPWVTIRIARTAYARDARGPGDTSSQGVLAAEALAGVPAAMGLTNVRRAAVSDSCPARTARTSAKRVTGRASLTSIPTRILWPEDVPSARESGMRTVRIVGTVASRGTRVRAVARSGSRGLCPAVSAGSARARKRRRHDRAIRERLPQTKSNGIGSAQAAQQGMKSNQKGLR